jgi:uncharacterized protein (DUF1501 family)
LSGFDTHQNQTAAHANLLSTLSGALAAFQQDLKERGKGKDVLTLTVSEFGRSVPENSMGGTDHGAANCLFAIGEGVHGGVYGSYPALNDLDNGALKPNVDFRQVYATILEKWLGADSEEVLNGHFKKLDFL